MLEARLDAGNSCLGGSVIHVLHDVMYVVT
jgi:hypothetical protein